MNIKRQTVVDQVMDEIRGLIASGDYKAGDRFLTEKELSEQFGIGRSSIREALKVFNYMGVLESKPALGSYISESSNIAEYMLSWSAVLCQNDMEDIIDMRGAMELWGLILLLKNRKANGGTFNETVSKLREIVADMGTAVENKDYEELNNCDYEFHYTIIKASRNKLINSVYKLMRAFMREEIKKAHSCYEDLNELVANHARIINDIVNLDAQQATEEHVRHILHTKQLMKREKSSDDSAYYVRSV